MDENTELRIILNHYFNDTHFTECLLNDNCTETGGAENDTLDATAGLSPPSLPQYFYILVILIYILIFLAGILGNSLVIFVVMRFPGLHTVTNTYILNLAIADMCFLLGKSQLKNQELRDYNVRSASADKHNDPEGVAVLLHSVHALPGHHLHQPDHELPVPDGALC